MGEVVAAVVAVVAYIAGAVGGTAALVQLVVAIAATAYSYKQSADQKTAAKKAQRRAQMETQQRNSFRNFRQPLTARRVVYGRCRCAGPFIFAHNPDEGTRAHLVVALASHEIDAIEEYYILNDQVFVSTTPGSGYGRVSGKYTKNVIIWPFLGTAAQDIGLKMRTATDVRPNGGGDDISLEIIEDTDKFSGIAALYIVTHNFGADLQGSQPDFSALVRGKKIFDPRTSTTVWSENPALAARDWLVNIMGFPADSINEDALIAAANACDAVVDLADDGGTQKRYVIGGIIDADTEHREALDLIAETMAGAIRYAAGQWFIEAGVSIEPEAITFHESQVLSDYELEIEKSDRSLPNAVRGNFFDRETSQPMSFPQYILPDAEPGRVVWLDIELPLVNDYVQAQRIARIMLGRARARRSLSLEFDLRGMLVQPGNVVTFSAPEVGVESGLFQVDGWTLSQQDLGHGAVLTTRLDLIDYDPSIYDWDPDVDQQEIERGTVNLVPVVGGSEDAGNLVYTETDVNADDDDPGEDFTANYNFEWFEHLQPVPGPSPTQVVLTIKIRFKIRSGRYESQVTQTYTLTQAYTGGSGSGTIAVHYPISSSAVYAGRTRLDAFAQVKFADGSFGPVVTATYIG